jgi:hypothetical protein
MIELAEAQQSAADGQMVRSDKLVGVHLGVKASCKFGMRLGYSKIAPLRARSPVAAPQQQILLAKKYDLSSVLTFDLTVRPAPGFENTEIMVNDRLGGVAWRGQHSQLFRREDVARSMY